MPINLPSKDPDDTEPFFVVWCDRDGTNSGAAADDGELQGATISSSTWTVPTGITKDSDDTDAVTIRGVSFGINTVATIWLSGGAAGTEYTLTNK
ncbi:MAG: hypothetical protein GTO41_10635, partial [Burkholderiales bacterium]|nr:hypothetical protein [Burkholderiales bacterium]